MDTEEQVAVDVCGERGNYCLEEPVGRAELEIRVKIIRLLKR